MSRISPVDEKNANADTAEILSLVRKKMGSVPNLISTMAHSNAVTKAYLGFSQALSTGSLSPRLREQIALQVSELNKCGYCTAAHTVLGMGAGLTKEETYDSRRGISDNNKEHAALLFVKKVVKNHGMIADSDFALVKTAGYTDGEISEMIANIALTVFTNYFNIVAETEIDFPVAPELAAA